MKKERQIGIRVGVPAFFCLELEDVYKHSEGAHRALAFPDFVGLLVGIGLEQYRKQNPTAPISKETSGIEFGDEPPESGLSFYMDVERESYPRKQRRIA
jgi:hypothetical protein